MAIGRKGGIIVDSGQLIGLIIGVVVVIVIVVVATMLSRKRKVEANRHEAAEIREQARTDEIGAREREAKAARAEADAQQAEVEAERLREESRARQEEAEKVRAGTQEQLRKADELDPDGAATERDAQSRDQLPGETGGAGELRRDRSARNPSSGEQTATPGGDSGTGQVPGSKVPPEPAPQEPARTEEPRGDNPRNL